ncbi:hypothetical protein C5708_11395 [Caulobacter sp. CCUG 60055]|nr:FecR domain-containing protein [Caulobacter sp. CCUG 60055]MBQ1542231.1 FecR domain-containing protein [Caulobacteraceae bacterium]MCI3180864.1 hypothetical protein [Caulobacter sp. CCUG 60055]
MRLSTDRREAAAAWFAAQRRAVMSVEERAAFDDWRADPQNLAALNAMHELWGEMAAIKAAGPQLRASVRRRRIGFVAAAAAVAVATVGAGAVSLAFLQPFAFGRTEKTRVGEQRTETLPDGSVVNLNVATRLDYRMEPDQRRVRMREGQALFIVRKDKTRPFLVQAGDYQVRAVGTAFDVRLRDGQTQVAVQDGVVSVTALKGPRAGQEVMRLAAGQRVALPVVLASATAAPRLESVPVQSVAEWRLRTVSYEDASLAEVVEDLNRFFARPVRVDDPALAARRVTLRLQVDERENTLRTLSALLGLRVARGDQADRLTAGDGPTPTE